LRMIQTGCTATGTPMRSPLFRLKSPLAIVPILAIAMAVLPTVWKTLSLDWVDDAYALWGSGDMVVNHMEDHEGRWPRGWDDLRPYFDAGGGRVGGWSFDEYQRRVAIKWDVDPAALKAAARKSAVPTFRVITPRDGLGGTIGGHEPNDMLYRYFRKRTRR
jgi:hypothetical protein